MGWVYAFWALSALAVTGIIADVIALKRGVARKAPLAALVLKGVVIVAFVVWWLYFKFATVQGWEDLAAFAGVLVLSVPVLAAAVALDAVAVRALARSNVSDGSDS